MSGNVDLLLPSGAKATRADGYRPREYYVWAGYGALARLTVADVEALYADSIAADGGRELVCGVAHCCQCAEVCALEAGHHRPHRSPRGNEWVSG